MKNYLVLVLTTSALTLSACGSTGSNTFNGSSRAAQTLSATGWGLSADEASAATANSAKVGRSHMRRSHMGQGHQGGKGFGGHGFMGLPMMTDLALSAEQLSQLQALATQFHSVLEANRPSAPDTTAFADKQARMQSLQEAVKTAFLSDHFDVNALQSQFAALKPAVSGPADAVLDAQVDLMIKSYQVLSPEQRQKIADKLSQSSSETQTSPAADRSMHLMTRLKSVVTLTSEQESTLKTRLADVHRNRTDHHAEMKAKGTQILALLNQSSPDKAALKGLLQPVARDLGPSHHLAGLDILHEVLTAEQRQKWVEANGLQFWGRRGHGGHQGGMMKPGGHKRGRFNH